MNLISNIKKYKRNKRILFTTPSHSQGDFVVPELKKFLGDKIFTQDFSEVDGLDNLQNPTGIIKEAQENIAQIYGAQESFILTNGSSSGILALMLATLKDNDRVLITRNCHKSVYNGLVLTGAMPVWFDVEYSEEWGIPKPFNLINFETLLMQNPNIKTAIITSPTYEGTLFNISKIAEICNEKGIILIVDEAHGALFNFDSTIGTPALKCGIDACVQSLHKTAGALNPSALLHIGKNSKISAEKVQESLNLISTTSPSYPIMMNIEIISEFLATKKGQKQIQKLIQNIENFKFDLKNYENIHIYSNNNDITKILIKIDNLSGYELSDILSDDFNIEDEFSNSKSVLFLTGIGTTKKKLDKLKKALIKISKKAIKIEPQQTDNYEKITPRVKLTPRQAYYSNSKEVNIQHAIGKVAAEMIVPYPPGIPILLPGEFIQKEHLMYIDENKETIKIIS